MNYIQKGIGIIKDVKTYWRKPSEGNYMSYREIAAYSIGGIGAYSVFTMAQALLLSTTNVIIGNSIGIQPMHMYWMYLISVITNIPLTMVRANMVDNVKYKEGKYRPYLLRMGIPTIIVSMLFVFTPYKSVGYIWSCVLVFIYNFGLQFFYNFFYDAYENLIHVLSPNSQERTNVTAIKSVVYSLSPTITNFVTPIIAGKVSEGNIYDLRVYQWLYPFIAITGVALIVIIYAFTEEKIVIAKTHPMKIKFMDALREVAKNKYFWIISLAGWLGFLESCTYVILQWLYNYAKLCTPEQYAIITFIRGTAYTWGMVIAPFAIKKWGKKKVLIVTNLFNVFALALVYPLMGSIWTVLLCMYMNSVADSFILILNPAIQADIRDYQQYKSGERIDGMFGAVAMIGGFITMATSSVLPAVYEKYGINANNGYANMYDILYEPDVLYRLVGVLVILSAVGAALNVIPYFFYDLTETKQKAIIKILQIRAKFEDYGNGALSDYEMMETVESIRKSREIIENGKIDVAALKASKADKATIKAAIKANEEYEISESLIEEVDKFKSAKGIARLNWANIILNNGIKGIANISEESVTAAKLLPAGTKEEKELRKEAIADAKLGMRSKKAMEKYYPDGIKEFDEEMLGSLYAKENELAETKAALLRTKSDKEALASVSAELSIVEKEIKAMTEEYQRYAESTKVYYEAQKYVRESINFEKFGTLDSQTLVTESLTSEIVDE